MRVVEDTIFSETVNNETSVSESIHLDHLYTYSIQAVWTGGLANGSAKLQASNDALTWADVAGSGVTISGPGDQLWNVDQAGYKYTRLSVTSADTNDIVVVAKLYGKGF